MERKTIQKTNKKNEASILFERLTSLMKEEKVYTNPLLNRRELANLLGTNEKYLREAIRTHADMTVNEYINSMRLHHACELLQHPKGGYTIESIAIDSGFGARNTFHHIFRAQYGITPDEFRRSNK